MFGKNIVIKQDRADDGTALNVQSVFGTIQGEGPYSGRPAIFVRLAGCNLRCFFCDTDFESKKRRMPIHDIFDAIQKERMIVKTHLVVITGGEPMIQNLLPFVTMLAKHGYNVQLETAGTVWVDGLEHLIYNDEPSYGDVSIVCSPKTKRVHPMIEECCEDWKYVISTTNTSDVDGLPILSTQKPGVEKELFRPKGGKKIYVQPMEEYFEVMGTMVPAEIRSADNRAHAARVAMKYGYRLSLQMHKFCNID